MTEPSITNADRQLAIIYCLGELSANGMIRFRERLAESSEFRREVDRIDSWLADLRASDLDAAPPEGLFDAIAADIDWEAHPVRTGAAPAPATPRGDKRWRALALASSAVAVVATTITGFTLLRSGGDGSLAAPQPAVETPVPNRTPNADWVTLLDSESRPGVAVIVYDPVEQRVLAKLSNFELPPDADLQLWLIRDGIGAPASLGVVPRGAPGATVEWTIPTRLERGADTLAISLEARGGSRSGQPEGEVLATSEVGL